MDYITEKRLKKVTAMMQVTNLPIDDIAVQSGFTSPISFYAIFKKRYGMTPTVYRKAFKKDIIE